jgi:hypothetical protein
VVKNKNFSGYLSLFVFILSSASFFLFFPDEIFGKSSLRTLEIISNSGFDVLNGELSKIFGFSLIKIQSFIAFAYTYHYLNWFSKVDIIKWHNVSKEWMILSILLWIFAVGLYVYDYRFGLSALLFLSVLHVFLEFPLNFKAICSLFGKPNISN